MNKQETERRIRELRAEAQVYRQQHMIGLAETCERQADEYQRQLEQEAD